MVVNAASSENRVFMTTLLFEINCAVFDTRRESHQLYARATGEAGVTTREQQQPNKYLSLSGSYYQKQLITC